MANLFRGYLPAKGKKPLCSVKDEANWLSEPPEHGDYVGILKQEYIQVDFDTAEDANIALRIVRDKKLRCDVLKTTRGYHFYFVDDGFVTRTGVHQFTAIGLPADIGLGKKDRVVPQRITSDVETTIIVNGKSVTGTKKETIQREWIQTYDELDSLPPYFRVIGSHDPKLKTTETRNQTLFNYILPLTSLGFTKEETRKVIKCINDYVLPKPLPDDEINTLTRDEAFSETFFFNEKGNFKHDIFGNYMLANSNIVMIDDRVHIYTKEGVYSDRQEDFEKVMIDKIPSLKDSQRKEVFKYISLRCQRVGSYCSPRYLAMANEIYDIKNGETFPYSPKWIINNRIPYDYNPNAYNETMDKTLDKICCNDKQIRALLEEMIGYTLYRQNSMQVCFMLTGEGSNGKSTLLDVIKALLGKRNYTSIDLKDLEDTFKPAELYGKLANIADDISGKFIGDSAVFKKVVTGNSMLVRRLYGTPFELESYATQIFCANRLPQVDDKSDGFVRRIIIVPLNAKFSPHDDDYDPFINDKLLEDSALEYLLKLAIDGLKRVLATKSFTKSDKAEHEKSEYVISNNNVLEWIEEDGIDFANPEPVNDIYSGYAIWCDRNRCNALKKANFTKELQRIFGVSVKVQRFGDSKKSTRVYVKEKKDED